MIRIAFVIPGKPQSQERRIVIGKFHQFDPPKSRQAKAAIRLLANNLANGFKANAKADFSVALTFWGAHGKCDIDNLSKLVLDALKGIWWRDDNQVYKLTAIKKRCRKISARTEIEIEEIVYI